MAQYCLRRATRRETLGTRDSHGNENEARDWGIRLARKNLWGGDLEVNLCKMQPPYTRWLWFWDLSQNWWLRFWDLSQNWWLWFWDLSQNWWGGKWGGMGCAYKRQELKWGGGIASALYNIYIYIYIFIFWYIYIYKYTYIYIYIHI